MQRLLKDFVDDDARRDRLLRQIVEDRNREEGVLVEVKTPATANQQFTLVHGLGRRPERYWLESQTKPGILYASSESTWDSARASFKYSDVSDTIKVRLV